MTQQMQNCMLINCIIGVTCLSQKIKKNRKSSPINYRNNEREF